MLATQRDFERLRLEVKKRREARGWTQTFLAKKLGITLARMNHVERGYNRPSLAMFVGLRRALGDLERCLD